MKEYTILAVISVFITILVDRYLHTDLLKKPLFYLFLLIIAGFKLLVNGALTKSIVMYNPLYFLGIRIGTIPLEDFLFGFSMVTLSIIFWEIFKEKEKTL